MQYHVKVAKNRGGDGRSPPYRAVSEWLLENFKPRVCDSQQRVETCLKRAYESMQKKMNASLKRSLSKLAIDTVLTNKLKDVYDFLETPVPIKPQVPRSARTAAPPHSPISSTSVADVDGHYTLSYPSRTLINRTNCCRCCRIFPWLMQ